MRNTLLVILLLALPLLAETPSKLKTLTLTTGKKYESVTIRKIEPDGIRIMYAGGMAKIPYEKLTEELQKEFGGFDADKAAAFRKGDAKKQGKARAAAANLEREIRQVQQGNATKKAADAKMAARLKTAVKKELFVFNITKGGMLVNNVRYSSSSSGLARIGAGGRVAPVRKSKGSSIFYLKGDTSGLVDGQYIEAYVIPSGTFQYNTVQGGRKTVIAYDLVRMVKGKKN